MKNSKFFLTTLFAAAAMTATVYADTNIETAQTISSDTTYDGSLCLRNSGSVTQTAGTVTAGRLLIHTANNNQSETYSLTGGVLEVTGGNSSVTGTNVAEGQSALIIGHWGNNGGLSTLSIGSEGVLNVTSGWTMLSWDTSSLLNIEGEANLHGISFSGGANYKPTATLTLKSGGRLNLGSGGFVNETRTRGTVNINLEGGTLGALDSWSASVAMNVSGDVVIDTTKRVSNSTAASTEGTEGATITLSGNISGDGSLTVEGLGALDLAGAVVNLSNAIEVAEGATVNVTADTVFALAGLSGVEGTNGTTYTLVSGTGTTTFADGMNIANLNFVGTNFVGRGASVTFFDGKVTVTGGAAGTLTWAGTDGNNTWNSTETNWTLSPDSLATSFMQKDNVVFKNADGVAKTVNLVAGETLAAGTVTVESGDYTWAVSDNNKATISGNTLTIANGASLTVGNQGNNTAKQVSLDFDSISVAGTLNFNTSQANTWSSLTLEEGGKLHFIDGTAGVVNLSVDNLVINGSANITAQWDKKLVVDALSGAGDLTITGMTTTDAWSGRMTIALNDLSDYTGAMTLNNGSGNGLTLNLGAADATTTTSADVTLSGGIVNIAGTTTISGAVTQNGGTLNIEGTTTIGEVTQTGGTINILGTTTFSGTATLVGVKVNSGELKITGSTATFNGTGDRQALYAQVGDITIGDGTNTTFVTATRLEMGDLGSSGESNLTVNKNVTLKITGGTLGNAADTWEGSGNYRTNTVVLGAWNASTAATIAGTLLVQNASVGFGDTGGSVTVSGMLAAKGLGMAGADNGSVSVALADGGKLILGDNGISSKKTNFTVSMGEGTIGTYSDSVMTIAKDVTLNSTKGTTFDTQKYAFDDDGNSVSQGSDAGAISITGVLSGSGKLIKTGSGTLTLSGANTFSGGLELSEGKVIATVEDALGAGDITLGTGTTLETATASLGSGKITIAGAGISLNATSALTADGLEFTFGVDAGSVALSNFTFTNATVDLSALTIDSDYTIFTGYSGSAGISVTVDDTSTGRLIIRSSGNVVWRVGDYLDLTWSSAAENSVWDYTSNNWDGDADFYTNENALSFAVEGAEIQVKGSDFSAKSIEIGANTTFKQYDDNAYAITTETLDVVAGKTLTLADKGTLKITGSLGANGALVVGENATLVIANTATSVSGTLSGNGRVEMASSSISVGNTFRDSADWTGTVALSGIGNNTNLSNYGNAGSWVEISKSSGYLYGWKKADGAITANIYLKKTTTAGGEEVSAYNWTDGQSTGAQTATFTGALAGDGTFEKSSGKGQHFVFSGDTSEFTGTFKYTNSNENSNLMFGGEADALAAKKTIVLNSDATIAWNDSSTGSSNVIFNYSNDVEAAGKIVSGVLEKKGAGALTLSNANTYTGGTTISGGKLVAANASALGTGAVTNNASLELKFAGTFANSISGTGDVIVATADTLTLGQANTYTSGTTISGGKLIATNAAALGTGSVTNNASLELNFDGEMSNVVSGNGALVVSGGNVELSGTNTYSGVTTISGGKLVATNAAALGTGPVTITNNASLELNFDGEMNNVVSGSGALTVVGGTVELSGANTYIGGTTISGGKLVMTNASALGTGPVTNNASLELNYDGAVVSEVSGNGMLSVANGKTISADSSALGSFTGETNVGGTLNLNADSDGALKVTGSGLLNKTGSGALTLKTGSTVANISLTEGALKNVALGSNMALTIAGTGTTLDALAMSDGTLDVSAAAVTLGGTTELSGGTIKLGAANATNVAFNVTGTMTITNGVTFNFETLETPTTTDVTVTYQVFSGGTLVGWNADTLSKSNFEIGDGAALSDRASLTFNTDGSVTIANKVYTLEWSGDGNSTWAVGSTTWTNKTDANASDTAYMNSDKVIFASDASVTLGSAVAPETLEVNAGVKLTLTGDANNKITGAGTVSIGEGASLILNSGHDYTGVTTLADGASLQLNLSGDSVALKSNLALEDSAKGTLIVNAASDCSLDDKFTGSLGDGAWTFKKEGEGVLSVSGKLSALDGDDKVRVAAGTLKLMSVGAIGSAQAEIESGATLEVASATDANFAVEISGDGNFRKSGGGKVTLASANESFAGDTQVAEGMLRLENASALGAGFKNTSIELGANTALEIAFGGSFGKTFKGKGTVDAVSWERLILSGDSSEFTGTFKVNDIAVAKQASSFGNGILQVAEKALVAFELMPTAGNSIVNEFGGVLAGAGSVSVETGVGVEMIFSGDNASDKFSGKLELKDRSTLVAYRGDVFGTSGDVDVLLGDRAVLQVGSGANSVLAAQLSGAGALTKIGSGTLTLENPDNDFTGMIRVEDGTLKASPAALGKSAQVSLDSDDATLHLLTDSGKTATLTKFVRGSGNVAVSGGGKLLWKNSEKRFSGNLTVSEKTTLNTDEFVDVESGHVVLENGAVWEATQGFAVRGDSSIVIASAQNTIPVSAMQLRASQTLVSGTQLNVGSFVAAANKSGEVLIEDITVTPTNGGNGALIAFELDSVRDAAKPRITLTHDASVVLDNVAVEVTLNESIRDAWDVPEIKFVWRDGTAADISGEIESVTVIMADGSEVKYLYDTRSGSLSLSPISPEMNLAYAAMVAMPTETFSQDVQSLHRRMEQRRFEAATSKDEWQFFAQAQSMSIENGDDRADSATFDFSTYGTLVGGDVRLNASTVFGMALAYDHGTADIHGNQGEITMDSYRATIYAGTVIGDYCFAEGGAHFGFGSYEIERRGSYGDNKGDTDGWSAGAFVNAGRLIPTAVEDLYLTPYVGLAYLHSSVEEIEETGTRSMKTDGFDADSLRARVGIGASYAFELGETPTRFGLDLAYSHEFLDDEVEADVVASGVDYARTLKEKVGAEDAISVGASFDFSLSKNTGLFLNYTVDFGMNSDTAHRGNIGFRFTY